MKRLIILALAVIMLVTTGCSRNARDTAGLPTAAVSPGTMKVHFIDVGQADAILVQVGQQSMLVDAGNNDDGEAVVNYLKQLGIKKLAVIMGTHPHEDHIGGLDDVIKAFEVEKIYLPKVNHNTKTYRDVLLAVKEKKLKAIAARGGQSFSLGEARVDILAPNSDSYQELNEYSIVCKVTFGASRFLLTGDAEKVSESEMLQNNYDLQADVLKIAHHGSSSSTGKKFLKAVAPQMAVISVGSGNDYGHPHRETLQKLASAGIKVYRTDLMGTIVMTTDGQKIEAATQRTAAAGK
ncbi:ComEC/Rec2 family competence protein [Desulforamulus hydrothermalis]|uniref:Beta-lactamase domain protein n=1 Tax=Desulforamulus hydrothermalis Lam5 = DSM 18033 TaxID=1121428 RepID=K8E823_9FIRM|nr:ComEC/Rec2 family competence protein [Desulforamulus hydrothermalis]CCO07653.1 Beta-lactamase domain protein [Desulforamulus hydrothermalis Lam5 = DSM 18033]SHH24600.1 competence protein ComEC [Desulforamulus hydrothermalis Lam5 = DSM 18033]